MFDEETLRRPDFVEGVEILLADGRLWTFPMPDDPARGRRSGESTADTAPFGPDYPEVLEAIREAEDDADVLRAELALAICLLRRNYDLEPEHFEALLRFSDQGALARMQRAMARVASVHLRPFRARRRPTLRASEGRIARPSPIRACAT